MDFQSLKPSDHQANLARAFEIAEKHLGVTRLLDPEGKFIIVRTKIFRRYERLLDRKVIITKRPKLKINTNWLAHFVEHPPTTRKVVSSFRDLVIPKTLNLLSSGLVLSI